LQATGSGNDADEVLAVRLWINNDPDGAVTAGDEQVGQSVYTSNNGLLRLETDSMMMLPMGATDMLVTYDFWSQWRTPLSGVHARRHDNKALTSRIDTRTAGGLQPLCILR